jgi:hypothetical protein
MNSGPLLHRRTNDLPHHLMIFCSDRIILWAGNEMPKSMVKISRLQSSMTLKVRIERPSLSESLIKLIDQT